MNEHDAPLPEPYYLVNDACEIAGCTTRQFYRWLELGYVEVHAERGGPITLSRLEVADLRDFATAMKLPHGKLARALLTARASASSARHEAQELRARGRKP